MCKLVCRLCTVKAGVGERKRIHLLCITPEFGRWKKKNLSSFGFLRGHREAACQEERGYYFVFLFIFSSSFILHSGPVLQFDIVYYMGSFCRGSTLCTWAGNMESELPPSILMYKIHMVKIRSFIIIFKLQLLLRAPCSGSALVVAERFWWIFFFGPNLLFFHSSFWFVCTKIHIIVCRGTWEAR